ncbi:hypothetical protein GPJ56_007749 [Histomonas meleagridis]|uniref:uncharacterized protein n=1 Tax=Histomonas meleagridis TaxID=135588 RepID=UPI00355A16A3|nr:hypothetical protein GPJ56_007749 [Histomonas meleagridis]KAH0798773.1 hypothetical protein GO595_008638 [Histomonas meleagridis]
MEEKEKKERLIQQIKQMRAEQAEIYETISLLRQKKQTLLSEKEIFTQAIKSKKVKIPNDTACKQLLLLKKNYDEEKELSASLIKEFQELGKMQSNREHEIETESREISQNLRARLESYLSTESELKMKFRQRAAQLMTKLITLSGNVETCSSIQNYLSQCSKISLEIAKCQKDIRGLISRSEKLQTAIKYPDVTLMPKFSTYFPLAPNGPKVAVQRRISYTAKARLSFMSN